MFLRTRLHRNAGHYIRGRPEHPEATVAVRPAWLRGVAGFTRHFLRPPRLANLGREMDVRPAECHHDASIRRARKPVRGSVWTSAVVSPIVPLSCS
jgi:hypothetical protein